MKLSKFLGKNVQITLGEGSVLTGYVDGFSSATNNDESGEDELYLSIAGSRNILVTASEIASIQVLEPAQSKKRFPLVAASL
jgi:hypothetical protein